MNPNDQQILSQIASGQKKQRSSFALSMVFFTLSMGVVMFGISNLQTGNLRLTPPIRSLLSTF